MKIIKMQNSSLKEVYSGVYKISFPNGKSYIGISNNMYRRMLEHNTDFRNNLPIEFAIKKYGPIQEYEILEEISPSQRELMRQREKFWIEFYKTNQKEFGYNISDGGDGADIGAKNHEAKFTEEEILTLYEELKDNILTLQQIANKYNIHLSTLSRINNGHSYYHSSVEYPIRTSKECKKVISGLNNINSYLDEQILELIYQELLDDSLSMKEIANKYRVSPSIVQNINSGKTYFNNSFSYPLRKKHKTGARKISEDQIQEIIYKIQTETNKSLAQIGRDYMISSKTMSSINLGSIYKQKNIDYPIRKK